MAQYQVTVVSTLTAANVPFFTIKAGASSRMEIVEIGVFEATAVASLIGLARSATATTTPTIVLGQALNPADVAAIGGVAIAWGTIGTANAINLEAIQLPATVGAGVIWTWPESAPLVVPAPAATGEIMLVNRLGVVCATFVIKVRWRE